MAKKKKRKKGGFGWRGQVLAVFVLLTAIIFMPSTILLLFGMLPTIAIAAFGAKNRKAKAITVGAMNLAGCTPFLLHLWTLGHDVANALVIITDPRFIIIMWSMAGVGYMVDWSLSGIVAKVMIDRGRQRIKNIKQQQEEMVERWGVEVTGEIPLDRFGFPVEGYMQEKEAGDEGAAPKTKT